MDLHLASRPQLLPPHDGRRPFSFAIRCAYSKTIHPLGVFEFSIIYGRERIFRTNSLEDAQGWIQALEEAQGLPPRKDTLNARAALGMNVQTNPLDLDVGQEDPTAPDPGSDSKREEQPEGDDTTEPQSNPQQPHGKSSAETKPAAPPVDQKVSTHLHVAGDRPSIMAVTGFGESFQVQANLLRCNVEFRCLDTYVA